MKIKVTDDKVTYLDVSGEVGGDEVLLDADDNLVEGTPWERQGFVVEPFLDAEAMRQVRAGIAELVRELLVQCGAEPTGDFRLERYHRYVGRDQELHLRVARQVARGFSFDRFPVPADRVVRRIGEICRKKLRIHPPGSGEDVFCLRIVRPRSRDNNPLHRDVWLDRLRHAINVYAPVVGSDARSSLAVVPESHRWKESEIERTVDGAVIDSIRYTVPAVVGCAHELRVTRPDPGEDEVLVFSPYLIHGGATNLNEDATRVSLEMRFWRAGS